MRIKHEFVTYDDAYKFAKLNGIEIETIHDDRNFYVETEESDEKLYDVSYDVYEHYGKEHKKIGTEKIVLPKMTYMEMRHYVSKILHKRSDHYSGINFRVKERE